MLFLDSTRFLNADVPTIYLHDINKYNSLNNSYIFWVNYLKKMFSLNNSNLSLLNITSGTELVNFKRNIDLFFVIHSFLKGNKKSLTLKELMDNSDYKIHILEERLVWLIHQNLISVEKPK